MCFVLKQKTHLRWTHDRSQVNWESLFDVMFDLMKYTLRKRVSLVSETGIC